MSGIYGRRRAEDEPPRVAPAGALGDIGSGLFAVIGVLAALRHRDATGEGQHVDIAMLDSMVALTDIVTSLWSLGLRSGEPGPRIMHGFREAERERGSGVSGKSVSACVGLGETSIVRK